MPLPGSCCRREPRTSGAWLDPPVNSLSFGGIRVDDVTLDEAVALAEGFVRDGEPRQIATINPEFVMAAQRDDAFRETLANAALCVPDGVGLMWGSRLLRKPLRGRATGVDLVWQLSELASRQGWSVFLLGGRQGAGAATAQRLQARYPSLRAAGVYEGHPNDPEAEGRVKAARPDILFVAYGAPAQDVWIHRRQAALGVPLAMGVGGSFDYIAGRAKRAPGWLRQLGLEWLYRLAHEPWRWRRMTALPRFAILVMKQRRQERR